MLIFPLQNKNPIGVDVPSQQFSPVSSSMHVWWIIEVPEHKVDYHVRKLPTHWSTHPLTYQTILPSLPSSLSSLYSSIHPSTCPSTPPPTYMYQTISVLPFVHPFIHPSICVCTTASSYHETINLNEHFFLSLSWKQNTVTFIRHLVLMWECV